MPVRFLERRNAPEWLILSLACTAQFMVVLDASVVNVALPSIGRDLHYSTIGLQWVVNAYVLTFAGFLLLGGRAADIFGRRKIYISGLALFSAASLVGGFAQNAAWLTTARALQGVGGAVLSPSTLTIIVTTFSGTRLVRAIGVWSAVGGAGGAAGVALGGVLTSELSWRWVLYINVPIGAAAMLVALVFLSEARRPSGKRMDVAGALTATAGLATLIYGVVNTDTHPWGSGRTLGTLGLAAILLGLFVVIERRWATSPLVPFSVFRSRALTGANLVMLLIGAAFFSMWYFLSLFMQDVLGYDPLRAGLSFLPMGLAIIVGSQISARVLPRTGVRPLLLVGTAITGAGFAWLTQIHAGVSYWGHLFGPGCVVSFSLGILFTPLATAATAGVNQADAGLASGVLNTSRQVGGSIGLAALATAATARTRDLLAQGHVATRVAVASGFQRAFAIAAVLGALGFAGSFIVPKLARPAASAGAHDESVPVMTGAGESVGSAAEVTATT
jgi:EmrB/QacA subfamily drug resistance transporter